VKKGGRERVVFLKERNMDRGEKNHELDRNKRVE